MLGYDGIAMVPSNPPFDGSPTWRAVHVLCDGTEVVVRPITPDDREELRREFESISEQTRYLRFFAVVAELDDETLDYLTVVDQVNHVALVAVVETPDLKTERGVGVARFIRLNDVPSAAESAITVIDSMQRKGLGTILANELGRAARVRGIRSLRSEVMADNQRMRAILEHAGATRVGGDGATLSYDLVIPAPHSSFVDVLRGAAQTMAMTIRRLAVPSTPPRAGDANQSQGEAKEGFARRRRV